MGFCIAPLFCRAVCLGRASAKQGRCVYVCQLAMFELFSPPPPVEPLLLLHKGIDPISD